MTFKVTLRTHNISHIGQVKIDLQGDIEKTNEPFKYFLPFKLVLKIWEQEIDGAILGLRAEGSVCLNHRFFNTFIVMLAL